MNRPSALQHLTKVSLSPSCKRPRVLQNHTGKGRASSVMSLTLVAYHVALLVDFLDHGRCSRTVTVLGRVPCTTGR